MSPLQTQHRSMQSSPACPPTRARLSRALSCWLSDCIFGYRFAGGFLLAADASEQLIHKQCRYSVELSLPHMHTVLISMQHSCGPQQVSHQTFVSLVQATKCRDDCRALWICNATSSAVSLPKDCSLSNGKVCG
jgi:hypothetical protein